MTVKLRPIDTKPHAFALTEVTVLSKHKFSLHGIFVNNLISFMKNKICIAKVQEFYNYLC